MARFSVLCILLLAPALASGQSQADSATPLHLVEGLLSAGPEPDGTPVPSSTFYANETVYFYTKVSWNAAHRSAGTHRLQYKFYTDGRQVLTGGDTRGFDTNPTFWWAWEEAATLGPGRHSVTLYVDGEPFAGGDFEVKPGVRPYEPAEDVTITEHARTLLLEGDMREFDELATTYRGSGERTTSGTWKLSLLYRAIDWRSLSPRDPVWDRLQRSSDAWLAQEPRSVSAVILNAHVLLDHSVCWRGEGSSKSVPPENWSHFRELTERARVVLDQHAALAELDPEWDALRIRVARQQGADSRSILAMAARALDRHGYYYPIHSSAVNALLPRWGGSREAIQEYVQMALAHSREREGTQAYARIFYYMARSSSEDAFVDMNLMGENWPPMRRSLDELLRSYPSEFNRSLARALTCMVGDADAYRTLGRAPTGDIESVGWWDTRTWRGECNGWAFEGKHAPGSLPTRVRTYTSFLAGAGVWMWVRVAAFLTIVILEGGLALVGHLVRRRTSQWQVPPGMRAFNPLDYPRKYLLSINSYGVSIRLGVWVLFFGGTAAYLLTTKPAQDALETAIAIGTCVCVCLGGALILLSKLTSTVSLTATEMSIGALWGGRRALQRDEISGIRRVVTASGATLVELVARFPEGASMKVPLVWREDDAFRRWFESLPTIVDDPLQERACAAPVALPIESQRMAYKAGSALALAIRISGGGILAFFAYVPLFIAWGVIKQLVAKPSDTDFLSLAVISGCLAIAYFLLLLAYRAFTGRGRKEDGGLLPPWAMAACILVFVGIGVAILVLGVWQRDWRMAEGGFAYCCTATVVYSALRRRNRTTSSPDPSGGHLTQ